MSQALVALSATLTLAYYLLGGLYLLVALRYLLDFMPLHLQPLRRFLYRLSEPLLRVCRKLVKVRWRGHDFTPLLAVFMLVVLQQTALRCLVHLVIKLRS